MAIYHFSVQVISRSQGRSAVAAAAYRAGERLQDERYGHTYDYTKKNVAERAIAAPENAPAWVKDREQLWNAVEAAEKRKDAQLCREINIALPRELTALQQRELVSTFVTEQFVKRGMIADVAIHRDNPENPHAHIMLTMREITPAGFGQKVREWNDKGLLEAWRAEWANYANRALERAGSQERIDHRSLEAQGSDRLPTVHEGPHVRQMESRGIRTDRGDLNRAVAEYNGLVVSLAAYRREKDALVKETAPRANVAPVESSQKQVAVLIAKGKEIKEQIGRIDADLNRIEERLRYYNEQQQRISDRVRLEKQLSDMQQQGRSFFGLYNKNSKDIAELTRKIERLGERIQEHGRFAPSDQEAVELQAQQKQLEQTKRELSGQFFAVRNKVEQLKAGQEKIETKTVTATLRQVILHLKDKATGVPVRYVEDDLDKQVEKARFTNRGGVEQLHYRLQDGTERNVLFQNLHMTSQQRDSIFDMIGAAIKGVERAQQRDEADRQRQMKKKRRGMER
ncbi:MobA/MobL family protein (plasmid) [Brevibacillus composti]|uniref:MobA/MobL family protein n=1 Tax=Brevibacillus composti TaxID=2796470 RepID=A0A7T5JQW1_9BACL|nr:MobQ family relaxase [Brevibacillus composti]QQE76754.1 MobA/MobL family protein [Brevibacillus composti]QUO43826.1 MobA/MobL family protein [Brevibacillus composti]